MRHLYLALCAALAAGDVVLAQGSVTGQIAMLEAAGVRTADLANAVVWLDSGEASPASGETQIVMESRTFVPRVQVVHAGSEVAFPNKDPFRHNVFSKSGPAEFDLGLYARGETRKAKIAKPGVYPIFCNIHARMVAYIVAVGSELVTQPAADGRFSIANVPAGAYTLRVWHDRGGVANRGVTVTSDGLSGLSLQLDARNYHFVQHKNKFGQDYPPDGRDRY